MRRERERESDRDREREGGGGRGRDSVLSKKHAASSRVTPWNPRLLKVTVAEKPERSTLPAATTPPTKIDPVDRAEIADRVENWLNSATCKRALKCVEKVLWVIAARKHWRRARSSPPTDRARSESLDY